MIQQSCRFLNRKHALAQKKCTGKHFFNLFKLKGNMHRMLNLIHKKP